MHVNVNLIDFAHCTTFIVKSLIIKYKLTMGRNEKTRPGLKNCNAVLRENRPQPRPGPLVHKNTDILRASANQS
jgi:hypothetical protein